MFDEEAEKLLESLPGPVLAVDLAGEVVAINESTVVLTGRPRSELAGATLSELESENVLVEGAAADYEAALAELRESQASEETSFEIQIRLGGESPPRPFDARVALHHDDGEPVGTVWSLSSVAIEERYDETIEAMHSATRRLMNAETAGDAFEICGRAANEILGVPGTGVRMYDPEADVLRHVSFGGRVDNIEDRPPFGIDESPHGEAFSRGETVVDTVPDEDDPFDREVFSQTMYVPIGEYGVLSLGKMRGGFDDREIRFAEMLAENTAAALNSIEQREQLREQRRELQRQNERLDEFASIVAHDLENPIAVARGSIEAYRQTGSESMIDNALEALDRLEEIVSDVLSLAREGGTVEATEPVDLEGAAHQAWATVEAEGVELAVEGDPVVEADRTRLLRLLENLLDNAVEHGDADEIRVTPTDDGFCVVDDGTGVPPEIRETAFEIGQTSAEDGSGLGLAIVEDIATAHGWEVTLEDAEGGGTCIELAAVSIEAGE